MYGEYLSSCWQSEEHLWHLHTAEFLSQFREFITRESSRRLLFWRPQFHYFKNEDVGPAWTTWSLRSPLQWTLWAYGWLTFRVGSSLWLKESTSNILFRCFPGMLRSENFSYLNVLHCLPLKMFFTVLIYRGRIVPWSFPNALAKIKRILGGKVTKWSQV